MAQAVLAALQLAGVVQAVAAGGADAQHDAGGDGVGDVVEIAQHHPRAVVFAAQLRQEHAQGGGFGAAPDQRAQRGEREQLGIVAGVVGAVVGTARLQVHHHHVGHQAGPELDRRVQGRAGEALGVAVPGRHRDPGREIGKGGGGVGQRQARDQGDAGRQLVGARIGVETDVDRFAVAAGARQRLGQRGLREHFLEADHVGAQHVDLVCGPGDFRFVLFRRTRFQVLVQPRTRRGQVADIEGGKANFLLHNKQLLRLLLA
jgi:hypothetical protein